MPENRTAPRERPILFSGPMVRAILEGRKTVTRRVIKPGFPTSVTEVLPYVNAPGAWIPSDPHNSEEPWDEQVRICPYGQPGDRLWVRESFWGCDLPGYGDQPCVIYDDEWVGKDYKPAEPRPWANKFGRIPSIHMPRHCSRILLEVTAVRVERLQDISEEQAIAEGVEREGDGWRDYLMPYTQMCISAYDSFKTLWKSINGADSWDSNPWVWVVEFKRVTP